MVTMSSKGDYKKAQRWLNKLAHQDFFKNLQKYGEQGVQALAAATPVDSGETAASWAYEIEYSNGQIAINWINTHVNQGVNIAVILQYGHGTGTGGYVVGRDYINPAMRPVFDNIAESAWSEVVSL